MLGYIDFNVPQADTTNPVLSVCKEQPVRDLS